MKKKKHPLGMPIFTWYQKNKRSLPWRNQRGQKISPYHILVAEVMLQQTRVQTVIPYYKKFIQAFPTLESLAKSSLKKVLPYWAGLGYYSRIKNLHQSVAIFLSENQGQIPKTAKELQLYPGFGSYTAKAVSSQAFGERVSVLDGNVIRVLCRHENLSIAWWKQKEKEKLEKIAIQWSQNLPPKEINQALMELGAVICTPLSPSCLICPIRKTCKARKKNTVSLRPIKRVKKKTEMWFWKPCIRQKDQKIFLTQNHGCPFFKKEWLCPGVIQKVKSTPKKYHFRHSITHYQIFVKVLEYRKSASCLQSKKLRQSHSYKKGLMGDVNGKWVDLSQIKQVTPSSLMQKVLQHFRLSSFEKRSKNSSLIENTW